MESNPQRSHWNLKYEQGLPSLEKPDPFFVSAFDQFLKDQFPDGGTALDLAGGVGRHALWLAEKSWQVTVIDISEVAIHKLGQKALDLGLTLNLFARDASEYPFENAKFDLIVMFYHFDRSLCARVLSALKPGGFLICKSSLIWDGDERPAPADLRPLAKNEIVAMLPTLQVMIHRERPVCDRGVVEYVGMRSKTHHSSQS
jgi:2-polyprenyl-3-methyl-5-hydroxy-6-metoxy-1,4-benzoquinol methylase